MSDLLWLFTSTPEWYFSTLADPFGGGILSFVPATGAACAILGAALGVYKRSIKLIIYSLPFILSQAFVALAGAMRGELDSEPVESIQIFFLAAQVVLAAVLIYVCRKDWLATVPLTVFGISYAAFAAFVGGMSLAGDWV